MLVKLKGTGFASYAEALRLITRHKLLCEAAAGDGCRFIVAAHAGAFHALALMPAEGGERWGHPLRVRGFHVLR